MKKAISILLCLVLCFGLLAGCGSKTDNSAPADSGKPTDTSKPADSSAPADTTPKDERYGGTLRVIIKVDPSQAGFPISTGTDQNVLAQTAIESLGRFDESGAVVGWLAKEIITDPAAPSITLKLQENVTYHDGTKFNAKAVCDVWDILLENGRQSNFANVEEFKATGEYEVSIKLKEWRTDAVETLCVTCGQMFSPETYRKEGLEKMYVHIVGTGPFVQDEFAVGEKVTFNRNDNYWIEGQPYLDRVEWIVCEDATAAVNMLKTGDANLYVFPSIENYASLISQGFTRYGSDSAVSAAGVLGAFFASGKEGQAVSKLEVRQAIAHCIDHEALCDAFTEGLGVVSNQLGVPGTKEYNSSVKGYSYDPAKAKELLKQAGYDAANPCEISLTYTPAFETIFVAVANMMEEVGIKVTHDVSSNIGDKIVVGGADPYVSMCWWSAPTSLNAWFRYFSDHPTTMVGNAMDLKAAGVIDTYAKCMTAKTDAEQRAAIDELARLCVDEYCLYVPFYATLDYYVGDDTCHDVGFGELCKTQWSPETAWVG